MIEQPCEQLVRDVALSSVTPAVIESLPAAGHVGNETIDHHVPRSAVKSQDAVRGRVGRDGREAGDTADVDHQAPPRAIAEQQKIDVRVERRPLAPSRQITGPEVGHRRHAGPLGDDGRLSYLKTGSHRDPRDGHGARKVLQGLAVRADEVDRFRVDTGTLGDVRDGAREQLPQEDIQTTNRGGVAAPGFRAAPDQVAHFRRIMKSLVP